MNLSDIITIKNGNRVFNFDNTIQYLQYKGKNLFGDHFRIHPEDYEVIYRILVWAIQDEANAKRYNIALHKGILLSGPVGCGKTGCGKTTLMQLFTQMVPRPMTFKIKPARLIAFGTPVNVIGEIVLSRYDMFVASGTYTHATTNLNATELSIKYGDRVRSRMRSMFNLISFEPTSKDKRL